LEIENAKDAVQRVQLAIKEQENVSQRIEKQVGNIEKWKYCVALITTCISIAYLL